MTDNEEDYKDLRSAMVDTFTALAEAIDNEDKLVTAQTAHLLGRLMKEFICSSKLREGSYLQQLREHMHSAV